MSLLSRLIILVRFIDNISLDIYRGLIGLSPGNCSLGVRQQALFQETAWSCNAGCRIDAPGAGTAWR